MSKRKKIVILSCMVVLLAATAVCNFLLTSKPASDDTVPTSTYFSEYRAEHSTNVSEQILQLDSIINSAESDSEAKENALATKLRLTENLEKELYLESLIKAKGYENIVVMLGIESENVTVVVDDNDFTTDDAVSIYTVLLDEISASPENVRIIPIS
ncbi:MAG: SpoIIIAH-like family protein [Clostridia bacterium]|nr:SpoIIIAH-like family protein [Clostridia bacterium]